MRKISSYSLWIGNASDLQKPSDILAAGIEAVVEVADSEPFAILPRDLIRCRFPIANGGDNPPWLLGLAIESTAVFVQNDVPVLICCSAGMSRSVTIAAGGLARACLKRLAETLPLVVGAGPVDVSPGLMVQVQDVLGNLDLPP